MNRIDRLMREARSASKIGEGVRIIKSQQVNDVTLKLVYNDDWEEYIVQWWQGGKHIEKKDYFSGGRDNDSKRDAEMTMASMAKDIEAGKR